MFRLFEIKDGKFTTLPDVSPGKIKNTIIVSAILLLISFVSGILTIDEKHLWKFYNVIIKQFGFQLELPDSKNEKSLESKIELEIDNSIKNVEREYDRIIREADKKYQPRYIEEKNDETLCYTDECRSLAPPMRICAPWLDDCPSQ